MAVPLEAFSVIVRNSTLAAKYPGGLTQYRAECPNNTFCADEYISRISFMAGIDAEFFVWELAAKGLIPYMNNAAADVAMIHGTEPVVACQWLEFRRWGPATIAWLVGTSQGELEAPAGWSADRTLVFRSRAEIDQRLEYLGREQNVDAYRDKTTGKEPYAGRTVAKNQPDIARHDDLYRRACALIEGLMIAHGAAVSTLDSTSRQRLTEAIALFEEVIRINPGNWNAMWILGKVCQRLADHERSLHWFSRAYRVNADQPDVAREAAIAAMDAGRSNEAVAFCERAIAIKPDDPGLKANLALAFLFSDRPRDAQKIAGEAFAQDPSDRITVEIVAIIDEVLAGFRPCPHNVGELQSPPKPRATWLQAILARWKSRR